jgi:hypothetical protein
MENKKLFPVFNRLIIRGFKLIDKAPNRKFPRYEVYYFENSNEFSAAFYEESVLHKNKNNL